jgi:hypothetical protein
MEKSLKISPSFSIYKYTNNNRYGYHLHQKEQDLRKPQVGFQERQKQNDRHGYTLVGLD